MILYVLLLIMLLLSSFFQIWPCYRYHQVTLTLPLKRVDHTSSVNFIGLHTHGADELATGERYWWTSHDFWHDGVYSQAYNGSIPSLPFSCLLLFLRIILFPSTSSNSRPSCHSHLTVGTFWYFLIFLIWANVSFTDYFLLDITWSSGVDHQAIVWLDFIWFIFFCNLRSYLT